MASGWNSIKSVITRFKDLTAVGVGNIAGSAISAFFWLYIATILGAEHYGEVSYFIAIAGIAGIISFIGASNMVIVYTAKGEKIQSSIFTITLISGSIASIVMFLMFYNLGVSLYIIGNVIFGLAIADLLGRKWYKQYAKFVVAQRILMVILAISLYYPLGASGVIIGYALSFLPFVTRIVKGFRETRFDASLIRRHFPFMINSYVLDVTKTLSVSIDKIIVGPLFGFMLLGNYQLGTQFVMMLGIIPGIVYQYVLPQDASGNAQTKLKKVTILASVVLAALGVALSPTIVPWAFPKFAGVEEIVQIMSIAVIPSTVNLMYISKFLGNEKSRYVLIASVIFLSVQIIGIVILGGYYGVSGIAVSYVAATISQTLYLVSADRLVQKSRLAE